MAIYMKYVAKQLGEIKGAVTSKGHEKWIEVTSVEFGYTRPAQGQVATGAPVISELRMTRHVDMSSPVLAQVGITNDVAKVTVDRKSTRLNSSHPRLSRMPSSA